MSTKGAVMQPARQGVRPSVAAAHVRGVFESADFAARRQKRRRANALAKASRKKNRS